MEKFPFSVYKGSEKAMQLLLQFLRMLGLQTPTLRTQWP